ncbi:hypothetical protein PsYK624_034460 [Phanerochaete sordida]|uniref:Prolyl 4-hydroxylase alpha subunit Fe(2+) 2OG dioxygenase domain-containing protein n=1 Tax=Phanerochaete sordida TaxID=48140 RepID=A0A9P3G1M9_9APHY|nr:hypothetical protein PsYK624_034460 [Phanerochaete sordida]
MSEHDKRGRLRDDEHTGPRGVAGECPAESCFETFRDDMEKILANETLNWNSTFCFQKTHKDALDPVLGIEGLGEVDLPLMGQDVKAVKRYGLRVDSEENKQNGVIWEIDASKVSFGDLGWPAYVEEVVKDVSDTVMPNRTEEHFRCELKKLSIFEKGSRLLQNADSQETGPEIQVIATMAILLPSRFTGGTVRLSRDGIFVEHDCSASDSECINVLAWPPAVGHASEPITSGRALALIYHLIRTNPIQPSPSPPPAAPQVTFAVSELNRILNAYVRMQSHSGGPCKLVYLLDGDYPPDGLTLVALSGADAQRASALAVLAGMHDLALGLVRVHCTPGGAPRVRSDEDAPLELEFTRLVDAHTGTPLAPALEVADSERIPRDFVGAIRRGWRTRAPQWREYKDYTKRGPRMVLGESPLVPKPPPPLPPHHTRTALVLWARRSELAVRYSGRAGLERACAALDAAPARERALVDFVLARGSGDGRAAEVCFQAALRWRDLEVWRQVVEACAAPLGLSGVRDETRLAAVEVFGFESVRETFESMLNTEKRNGTRLAFLQRFDDWLGEPHAATKGRVRDVRSWIKKKKQEVLASLRPPSLEETVLLLDAARENGGLSYLKEHMLPQLQACADAEFLLHFANALHQVTSWKPRGKKEVIRDILTAGVAAIFVRPTLAAAEHVGTVSFVRCKEYTETCTRLSHDDLIDEIVRHLLAAAVRPELSATQGGVYAQNALIPFVNYLARRERVGPTTRLPSQFDELRRSAVDLWRKWGQITEKEIGELVDAAILPDGKLEVLVSVLAPAVDTMKLPGASFRVLVDALQRVPEPHVYPEDYSGPSLAQIIISLARRYAQEVPLGEVDAVTDAVQWVLAVDPLLGPAIFDRILAKSSLTSPYVKTALMPLSRTLCEETTEAQRVGALAPLLQGIVAAWVSTVPPTSDTDLQEGWRKLGHWTCPCKYCTEARTFLREGHMEWTDLDHIRATNVDHVKRELGCYAWRLARWETRETRPLSLVIEKSDALLKYHFWDREKEDAEDMLRNISADDAALQTILGAQYARIRTALEQGADLDRACSTAKRSLNEIYLGVKRRRY